MRVTLSFVLVFVSSLVFAQGSSDEYKVKENKLNKHAADLSFSVNPVFSDLSADNMTVGYSADLLFRLNTIMSLRGNYSGSYYNTDAVVKDDGYADEIYNGIAVKSLPFQYFHGELTLNVWTDVDEGKVRVNMPSEIRSGRKQRYYLELDKIDRMQQFGIRVGGGIYQSQISEKDDEFAGYDESKPISDITAVSELVNEFGDNYSSINYNLLSAGFSYEKVDHVVIEVGDSAVRKSKRVQWMIYGDALYGHNMQLGDMIFTEGAEPGVGTVYNLQKYTEVSEFGYRVGFERNSTGLVGFKYGIEAGARPGGGSFIARSYFSLKVGVSLNFKVLQY